MAKKHNDKLAIMDKTTKRDVTYSKALIASLILTSKFRKYDKGFIGIMIPTSAGCVLAILAALMSGRIPVMINFSTGAKGNAEYAQKKCRFKTIITSKALLQKVKCPHIDGMVLIEDIMKTISTGDKLKGALKAKLPLGLLLNLIHKGNEYDTSVILFTSGSEKNPKAVQLSHKNIASNVVASHQQFELSDSNIVMANLVLYHVFGLTTNLWYPLYYGLTMITYANPLDFRTISDIVRKEKPTLMNGTPSLFWGYLQKSEPGDYSSIKNMVAGADKSSEALRQGFLEKHGVTLLSGYGATETSPVISATSIKNNKPGSVGKALPGVQVRIENLETGKDCAPDEVGKILVKGDLVMKGYYNDPELTAAAIKEGWYDTGDMGYLDEDKYLWHSGRYKRFVKIGGEMVSLVKVEDVLESILPDGVKCCVVEVPDEFKGANVVAVVTQEVDRTEIIKQMEPLIQSIALPKKFMVIEELPMMGTGKIDFRSVTRIVEEKLA